MKESHLTVRSLVGIIAIEEPSIGAELWMLHQGAEEVPFALVIHIYFKSRTKDVIPESTIVLGTVVIEVDGIQ